MKIPDNYPKISIVTPSLNQGKYIEETIKSVLNQNYPNIEYIIIDGGSTDNTLTILKKYKEKIKWISEKDNGQADAINKALKLARGEIVTYLNSDDFYTPNTLKEISLFFRKNPKAKWVTGDYFIIDEKGEKIQSFIVSYKKLLRAFPYFTTLCFANFISQPSTFWRREVMEKIGLFNEELHYTMDYDYWLRTIKKFPLYVVNKPLSSFRIHSTSKGSSQYKKQFEEEMYVTKTFTQNKLILFLHEIHNKLIIRIYNLIKS